MNNLLQLLECFYGTPWAMASNYLNLLEIKLIQAFKQGSTEYLEMFSNPNSQRYICPATGATQMVEIENRSTKTVSASGGIGVLPIQGAIGHRANFISDYFGWPTTERLGQTFQQMADDPNVGAIILDINSPGGMAVGNEELHQQIIKNRGKKPVVAMVNGVAASAAYYIASAADEIVIIPSGQVGSIGSVMVHQDWSKYMENAGVKTTVITAGKYKWEGHGYEPLSEEALAEFQRIADHHYDLFVKAVAKGRGVSTSTVKSDFGQGRMVMAKDAVAVGMADRVGTMNDVIARLGGRTATDKTRMEADQPEAESTEATSQETETEEVETEASNASEVERLRLKNKLLEL